MEQEDTVLRGEDLNSLRAKVIVLGDSSTGKSSLIKNLNPLEGKTIDIQSNNLRNSNGVDTNTTTTVNSYTNYSNSGNHNNNNYGNNNSTYNSNNNSNNGNNGNNRMTTTNTNRNEIFFSVVEFTSEELSSSTNNHTTLSSNLNVLLKVWERHLGVNSNEEDLAYRGALITIITFDIRNNDTANSVFQKWIKIKEESMSESFLFVVGNFLDCSMDRKVQISDMCKACASKDAIYLEISNYDLTNISLLRKLICKKLVYMLQRREELSQQAFAPGNSYHITDTNYVDNSNHDHVNNYDDHDESHEENKSDSNAFANAESMDNSNSNNINSNNNHRNSDGNLSIPFLEQNVMCDSIGSILSSCIGTEYWPGYLQEQQKLQEIGTRINDFVDNIKLHELTNENNISNIDEALLADVQFSEITNNYYSPNTNIQNQNDIDLLELKKAFEMMGLAFPATIASLAMTASRSNEKNNSQDANNIGMDGMDNATNTPIKSNGVKNLRKMIVKFPNDSSADMIIDLEASIDQQIDLFLLSNGMDEDKVTRAKLIKSVKHLRHEYIRSMSSKDNQDDQRNSNNFDASNNSNSHQYQMKNYKLIKPDDIESESTFSQFSNYSNVNYNANENYNSNIARSRCRIKVAIPGKDHGTVVGTAELIVAKGEDLLEAANRFVEEHRLPNQMVEKILSLLRDAIK